MAGPFPGMDPYIEFQANWQDFHNRLTAEICNALGARMPDDYVARVDERVEIVGFDGPTGTAYRPDVLVAQASEGRRRDAPGRAVATLSPQLGEVAEHDPEEIRYSWVEIRRLPDLELVTVIEVLSPVNKTGAGREQYLEKRRSLHDRRVNLVEIDLLLGGRRLPMKEPLGVGDYLAVVARGPRLPGAEIYRWSVRDALPLLPIPLREPDPDVVIDLAELVTRVYDLGRYRRTLRHGEPLPEGIPLHPEDRVWIGDVARGESTGER